jgi:heme exporter protein A
LERVGLAALGPLPARALSAGQRRRLALARLLLAPRPLWLLDEPTGGLDVGGRELLGALMAEHLAQGGAIIAASHEPLPLPARRTLRFVGGSQAA